MTPFLESQAEKTSLGLWVGPLWREADSCGSHFSFSATCVSVIKLWWSGSVARAFILLPEPPDLPQITSFQQRNSENRSSTWGRSRNCAVCYETSAHCRPWGFVSKSEATLRQRQQCGPLCENCSGLCDSLGTGKARSSLPSPPTKWGVFWEPVQERSWTSCHSDPTVDRTALVARVTGKRPYRKQPAFRVLGRAQDILGESTFGAESSKKIWKL